MYQYSGDGELNENEYNEYRNASLISRILVRWIKPFIIRSEKKIKFENLCNLREDEKMAHLKPLLERKYESMHPDSKFRLIRAIFACFWHSLIGLAILCFISSALELFIPLYLRKLIDLIVNPNQDWHLFLKDAEYYITFLIGIKIVVMYIGNYSNYLQVLISIKIQIAINGYLYDKLLYRSRSLSKNFSTGEITTLMNYDSRMISEPFYNFLNIFSLIFTLALTFFFLYELLGNVSIIAVIITLFSLIILFITTKCTRTYLRQLLQAKSEQILEATQTLSNIKAIKMYSWVDHFIDKICFHRLRELGFRKRVFFYFTLNQILVQLSPHLVAIGTFCTFAYFSGSATIGTIFAAISLLKMLAQPMILIPQIFSQLIETHISSQRMEDFINTTIKSDDTWISYNNEGTNQSNSVKIPNCTFAWKSKNNNNHKDNKPSKRGKIIKNELEQPLLTNPTIPEFVYALRNINLEIKKGELVFIIGEVGSGKSSLLSAILGEMILINPSEKIQVNGSISFVDQNPWIQSMNIQDNICFIYPYDQLKMDETLKICQLEEDLKVLPHGLKTQIGERGINLSGGQKMRVSLARAIYARSDIYLMDDPFGSLDSHVKNLIFENCILSKLKGKTRLIVTHSIEYLSKADRIIVLSHGTIEFSGNYQQLTSSNCYNALLERIKDDSKKNESQKEDKKERPKVSEAGEDIVKKEQEEEGRIKCSIYSEYIKRLGGAVFLILIFVFLLFEGGLSTLSDLFLGFWGNNTNKNKNPTELTFLILFILSGIFACVFVGLRTLYLFIRSIDLAQQLHRNMIQAILYSPLTIFLERTPVGRILNIFSNDMKSIDYEIPFTFRRFLTILPRLFSIITICVLMALWSFIPLLLVILLSFIYFYSYVPIRRQMKRLGATSKSPIVQVFLESYIGNSTIRAFKAYPQFQNQFAYCVQRNSKFNIHDNAVSSYFYNRINLIGIFGNLIILILAILKTSFLAKEIVGLAIIYAITIQASVTEFFTILSDAEATIVAFERCLYYTKIEREGKGLVIRTNNIWPIKGNIEFINFSVKYRPDTPLVLKGINLQIISGQKVGVVGRTGSGKSTLALSILRIIEAFEGQIVIDGQNIANIDLGMLRTGISIIPQDSSLFIGTLKYNIDPTGYYSDEKIRDALKKTGLDKFLSYQNENQNKNEDDILNFRIEEQGKNISSGERQLICLARAIIRNSKILIFDEATSSIDIQTESKIAEIMNTDFKTKEKTIITIAHRIHTILNSDIVVVLEDGKILELGIPSKLLLNQDSFFTKLINEGHIKTKDS